MHEYIFMFHLAPIIPFRADEIILDLHEYIRQYKIDSIFACTTTTSSAPESVRMATEGPHQIFELFAIVDSSIICT
jgi:hypothetical protein